MKKGFVLVLITMLALSCNKFDDSAIWNKLNDHEGRIAYLEEVCKTMNTNIVTLQTLVTALETNDYIINASPLVTGDGYTFTFKSGKSVVVYDGVDGVDGTDGKDGVNGKDGVTPVISVMKDVDGIYYWTVNNQWLLINGEKVRASAIDGKDGENGTDGTNGVNGANGKDGITPKFKIQDDYWYISYDNGNSWEKLGKASGSNGLNGADGDSIFANVSQDNACVYFYLSDGTMITLSKHNTDIIQFEDLQVKAICCKNWDTNGDGELAYDEAATVTELTGFNGSSIIAFTELKYFTGLQVLTSRAFSGCSSLWKVALPNTITEIGESAFSGCKSLVSIDIPDSVLTIGNFAFANCVSVSEWVLSKHIIKLGREILEGCRGRLIVDCNIPGAEEYTVYESDYDDCGMFNNCVFDEIVIGENVTSIGSYAFYSCRAVKSVTIGDNVISIGDYSFYSNDSLNQIIIPDGVESIGKRSFAYTPLQKVILGESLSKLGEGSFLTNSELDRTYNLEVYVRNLEPAQLGSKCFYYSYSSGGATQYSVRSNMVIYVPQSVLSDYTSDTMYWITYSKKIKGHEL